MNEDEAYGCYVRAYGVVVSGATLTASSFETSGDALRPIEHQVATALGALNGKGGRLMSKPELVKYVRSMMGTPDQHP